MKYSTCRLSALWFAWFFFLLLPAYAQSAAGTEAFRGLPVRSAMTSLPIEQRVDDILRQMTLEEKIGQLVQYSSGAPTGPGSGSEHYDDLVAKGQVGSIFNLQSVQAANQYQRIAVENSRLHIPLLFGLDVIHGFRTVFPVPIALASTWDPPVVEKAARVAATEASAAGVRWTFSPMVDIARDARWGRMVEGAGEDPFLGSEMARAYVRGYQGKHLDAPDSIAACVKHYVGYGAAEGGRDYNTVEISEHTLRSIYLPPFYAALDEGGASVMSAFNTLNGVPASANPFTLTQVLRKEWQFPGMVVSDWTSIGELVAHGIANDGATAALKALMAGVDMDMMSDLYQNHLGELEKSGKVPMAQIDEAVRRVLRVKVALGLFDNPYTDEKREIHGALPADNLNASKVAAERSFVMLKNEPGPDSEPLLPLRKGQTVALIGPLADDAENMLGAWAGRGTKSDVVTLNTALRARLGSGHVKYARGGEILKSSEKDIADAVKAARSAKVAILALGEDAGEMTAEAGSRAHLDLPGNQEELLERVVATGTPVVLILFSGRPLTLPWAFEHVPTVLAAWFPGIQAGPALVSVLTGEKSPSGRLVVNWPRTLGQVPDYYNALSTGRPAGTVDLTRPPKNSDEKYVSRYVDEPNAPQFPFGYGLTYSTVSYGAPQFSAMQFSAKELNDDLRSRTGNDRTILTITQTVKNIGKIAIDEVVQVYVGLLGTSVEEPVRALKAFQRVYLAAGEQKNVTFLLSPDTFSIWDINNQLSVEPCQVRIWVAPDSSRGQPVEIAITD